MVNFLHFSDLHIQRRRGDLKFGVDPCLGLERAIEEAREMDVRPAFSIITGDISQDGSEAGYAIALEYFREIEALGGPVFPAVGNVDGRGNFRKLLLGGEGDGPCYYSRTVEGVHVVILDSQTRGRNTGSFGAEQLDWLEAEVRGAPEPCVVAFHHPVFHVPFFPSSFEPRDAERFRGIVEGGGVLGVLCGHLHQSFVSVERGVPFVMSGSSFSEVFYPERWRILHEVSGFNFLSYEGGSLKVRPVSFSQGRKLLEKGPR